MSDWVLAILVSIAGALYAAIFLIAFNFLRSRTSDALQRRLGTIVAIEVVLVAALGIVAYILLRLHGLKPEHEEKSTRDAFWLFSFAAAALLSGAFTALISSAGFLSSRGSSSSFLEVVRSIKRVLGARRRARHVPRSTTAIRDDERPQGELTSAGTHRVLNAKLAKTNGEPVGQNQWLACDTDYDLLVDIGPRWIDSITRGAIIFPKLPKRSDGHRIQVVFVCELFGLGPDAMHVISEFLWLPNDGGASHPILRGETAELPGPIALRFKTISVPPADLSKYIIHGRLCVYWENNLLQSAIVKIGVAREPPPPSGEVHSIQVDYALTKGFVDLSQLRTRAIKPISSSRLEGEPIKFNITLNDDLGGGHRIIIPSLGDSPTFVPYSPIAAQELLTDARQFLMGCYWQKDSYGNPVLKNGKPILELESDNGRPLKAFKRDLFELAKLGNKLFGLIFENAVPEGKIVAQWNRELREALAESTTIQVARTGPANYVFPWGLIYDYPLADPEEFGFCRVIDEEWGPDGRRTAPIAHKCPYHHNHRSNIICPYGFWGLRHRIEQPPSLPIDKKEENTEPEENEESKLSKPARSVGPGPFYAAFTSDVNLDQSLIGKHISALARIPKLQFKPPPVNDWKGVQACLKSPKVMYFLCHGEFDPKLKEPYLGVGLRDQSPRHRIYVGYLNGFLRADADVDYWVTNRPLIIINGCHTANLRPGDLLSFVSTFAAAGAGGIIGTEISVVLEVAVFVGETLLASFTAGEAIADAIHSMRWQLANRGNLLGLAYTSYCMADLKIG